MVTLEEIMTEYVKVNFKELPRFFSEADQKDLYQTGFIRNSVKRVLTSGITSLQPVRVLKVVLSHVFLLVIVIGMKLAKNEQHGQVSEDLFVQRTPGTYLGAVI